MTHAVCQSQSTAYMCFYVTSATTASFNESNDANNVFCLATSSFLSCVAGKHIHAHYEYMYSFSHSLLTCRLYGGKLLTSTHCSK